VSPIFAALLPVFLLIVGGLVLRRVLIARTRTGSSGCSIT